MTPIGPIPGISSVAGTRAAEPVAGSGEDFAGKVANALGSVSNAERSADLMAQDVAAGGDTPVHELMVATTKATLSMELLVQVRNKAVEAYQEIMRMQV
ncbi:MAG: flagellar hook-basal body complex protein FliE [Acidimicrobiia bacterium]|nr:flagellar hook-basal body complex protein FliE [Acidimicrobiia bacterium]MDH4309330.1 flagellar hook-basal body complex protein FliE [Acidimicrobiia bacterium]MDH5292971.1 flagellar hook-basal body complex protein FliE [Acidimicrobiia bacterium]